MGSCARAAAHRRAYAIGFGADSVPAVNQVSFTAGPFSQQKTPLTAWFWATYLAVTDKRGVSALLLQRQLGLRRYETAGCCCTSCAGDGEHDAGAVARTRDG